MVKLVQPVNRAVQAAWEVLPQVISRLAISSAFASKTFNFAKQLKASPNSPLLLPPRPQHVRAGFPSGRRHGRVGPRPGAEASGPHWHRLLQTARPRVPEAPPSSASKRRRGR